MVKAVENDDEFGTVCLIEVWNLKHQQNIKTKPMEKKKEEEKRWRQEKNFTGISVTSHALQRIF